MTFPKGMKESPPLSIALAHAIAVAIAPLTTVASSFYSRSILLAGFGSIPSNRVSFSSNATRPFPRSPADGPIDAQRGAKKFRESARVVETANDGGNKAKERRGEESKGWLA